METTAILYRTDFYAWTQKQAALLQAEEFENVDLPNPGQSSKFWMKYGCLRSHDNPRNLERVRL